MNILDHVKQFHYSRLLLAISGGMDSMCLAHFFAFHQRELGLEWVGIAHVHHGLREGSADLDAELVKQFSKEHSIPFFLTKLDGNSLKNDSGSLEENARDARYAALKKIAMENKAQAIVTAHHALDQAETIYMRLRRGTTLEGLRGMQPRRTIKADDVNSSISIDICRPFLDISREELREYALENRIPWREDESNSDLKYTRNLIRHKLLPALESALPGSCEQLCNLGMLSNSVYDKLMNASEALFAPCLTDAESLPSGKKGIVLNSKTFHKTLTEHSTADLSELFRLWLSSKGLRFPTGFFKAPREPAQTRIPVRSVFRNRSILKIGHSIQICEFGNPESAIKFVSCKGTKKGL